MPTFRYTGTFLHVLSAHTLSYYHSGGTFVDREIVRSRAQSFLDRLDADKQDEESESRESPAELHELHEEQLHEEQLHEEQLHESAEEAVAQLEEARQAIQTQEQAAVDAAAETLQPAIDAILECDRTESPSAIDLGQTANTVKRVQFGSVRMRSVSHRRPHSVSHRRPHSVSQTPQPTIDSATPQPASDEIFSAMRAVTPMEGGDVRYKRCQIPTTLSRRVCH